MKFLFMNSLIISNGKRVLSISIPSTIYYFYLLFASYQGTISPLRFTSHDNPRSANAPTRFVKLNFGHWE